MLAHVLAHAVSFLANSGVRPIRQPIAIVLIFFSLLLAGCSDRVGAYRDLVDRHAVAAATVTSTDCDDHGNVLYTFQAAGKMYAGNTHWLDRSCADVRPGDTFPVNFDPRDPTVNTTMDPQEAYAFHRSQLTTGLLMATFVLGVFLYGRLRKRS